jgi:MoxR-like ATPase
MIYNQKELKFEVKKGPVFTNLLLADEINRAPAKVQSALLEVMQEKQITIAEETFTLDYPFFVMATQNPIEQEGTYRLPEAQLDRFMFKVFVGYNTKQEEMSVVKNVANDSFATVNQVFDVEDLKKVKEQIVDIHVDDEVLAYITDIIDATRNPSSYGLGDLKKYIEYGASPRGSINLYKSAKAISYLRGKTFVTPVDVAMIAKNVLRHRIVLSYEAELENISQDDIVDEILKSIPIP